MTKRLHAKVDTARYGWVTSVPDDELDELIEALQGSEGIVTAAALYGAIDDERWRRHAAKIDACLSGCLPTTCRHADHLNTSGPAPFSLDTDESVDARSLTCRTSAGDWLLPGPVPRLGPACSLLVIQRREATA